jgi:hypothetical protein
MRQTTQAKSATALFWLAVIALLAVVFSVERLHLTGAQRGRVVGMTAIVISGVVALELFKHRTRRR